jgi:tetratricopeptide (TPR) repeat protein
MSLVRNLTFISYANEDLKLVLKLYEGLKKRKVNAWLDKKDLKTGKWLPQIMKAISRSNYFIICLSNAALKKTGDVKPGFQDQELNRAFEIAINQSDDQFTIVPVRLEDCGRGDNRTSLFQQYDLFEDWEKELDKLAVNIGGDSLADTANDERTEDEKIIDKLMGKGTSFYYSDEYDKALSFFEAAINIKPDFKEAWYGKGGVLAALGRHEEAIETYNKAIEINPDYFYAWFNKGNALIRLSRYGDALKAYDKAIEIKPDDHEAWYNKGITLAGLDRNEEALEAYNKAIEIKPDDHKTWYKKGNTLCNVGRHDEAIEAYNKAIEINPDLQDAWYNLACLHSLKKDKTNALKFISKAIEKGYNNLSHIEKDTDLDFIRHEKGFQSIIDKL